VNLFLLLLRSSWKACLVSVVLGAISGPVTMTMINLIHQGLNEPDVDLNRLAVTFIFACAAVLVTQILSKCILSRLSQSTAARLQFELCLRIVAAPLDDLESLGPHRLLEGLQKDVYAVSGALAQFPTVCTGAMVLLSGIGYMALLSVPMALFTVVMALAGVVSYLAGIHWSNRHLFQAREDQDDVSKQLHAMLFGIKELKGNNRRCVDFVYDVLLPADTVMRERMIKGMDINGAAHSWGRLALFIGIGLLVFVWPLFWPVSREMLTGYVFTILYLTGPLDNILSWLPSMNDATISLNKINSLGLMIDSSDAPPVTRMPAGFESIELRGVTYHYGSPNNEESGFQLGPVDLTVSPGEVLFVAGGNGSGKTTLAKLLTGLYAPHDGEVWWNGKALSNSTLGNYRQLFATVFVEGHLFDRLIGVDVNPTELQQWVDLLGIEEKVDIETGRLAIDRLSRGQHKRLALLVACLDDRPIFLFDEWAAEQDPAFKEVFYQHIVPVLKRRGRTVVAITHDDRYFSAGDRVVKLVDGRIEPDARKIAA